MSSRKHERLAAVDLGSNSFHLQVGRVVESQIYLLDSIREPVRLGAGLNQDRRLDRAAQLRALEALGKWDGLKDRLVFGGDVSAVLAYVRRSEVAAGIVYARWTEGPRRPQ